MPNRAEKLSKARESLADLQKTGRTAIRTKDLTRTERVMLLKNGFIQMVMKGWYIPSRPDERPGGKQKKLQAVSYTHLTLPTIYSV